MCCAVSIVAAEAMELYLAGNRKPHPEIKLDGVIVFGADVKPGHQAVATVISHEMPDEARCMESTETDR